MIDADAPPLRAVQVGKRYQRRRPWALRSASFSVPCGSITALVGPNGAGKSTLIRACIGFEEPDEGRVHVFGMDPRTDRAGAVNAVGYVPQAAGLYRGLTIADHFVMAQAARPSFDRAYAGSRVEAAGLDEGRVVGQLSGGEQAQVALAIALGTRAPLLLLDEPLANLDPLARRDFLTVLIDDVRGRGATAILSSHIITDVEQACDRLMILAHGQLVYDDSVDEARETHRALPADSLGDLHPVGVFGGPDGRPMAVVEDRSVGRAASLEEIVLGRLSGARTTSRAAS